MPEDKNFLDKIVDKAERTADGLKRQYGLDGDVNSWPNATPVGQPSGFLPPLSLTTNTIVNSNQINKKSPGGYKFKDWRGHLLDVHSSSDAYLNQSTLKSKFKKSNIDGIDFYQSGYSTRDYYTIFNDHSTDFFKHKLTKKNLNQFTSTPFENEDPIIYGFDIIIDDISSPLLNGSIKDFLRNYSNISEINSKKNVYEDFKQQFIKFFKTKGTVNIDEIENSITNMGNTSDNNISKNSYLFEKDQTAYLNHYLKKNNRYR